MLRLKKFANAMQDEKHPPCKEGYIYTSLKQILFSSLILCKSSVSGVNVLYPSKKQIMVKY